MEWYKHLCPGQTLFRLKEQLERYQTSDSSRVLQPEWEVSWKGSVRICQSAGGEGGDERESTPCLCERERFPYRGKFHLPLLPAHHHHNHHHHPCLVRVVVVRFIMILSPSSSKVYACGLVSLSSLSLILISPPFIDGDTFPHTGSQVGDCEQVNPGESVMMEVDLRGEGRERTLHFFIEGRQQKTYFHTLPSMVEFCV